ncbi:MAG: cysteine hydrolase [bacterium]|jgi:nicotinamidase-related amidase
MNPYVTSESLPGATDRWLAQIAPFNTHEMKLRRDTAALLVIDMQKFFLDPASPTFTCGGLAVLENIAALIGAFRAASRPVIYTRHVHNPDGSDLGIMDWWWPGKCWEGTPESEVHERIAPLPGEKVVAKHRYSAFYNTDLETVLRCLGVTDIVVTGIMTNMCCESTARDAYYRDYRVFFPADATGSVTEEMHVASLLNLAFGFAYVNKAAENIEQMKPAAAAAG